METSERKDTRGRLVLAVILVVAGILLLADNFNLLDFNFTYIFLSWPMLLIVLGIINISKPNHTNLGIILICVGGFFIIPRIVPVSVDFGQIFWPLILVGIGVLILLKKRPGSGEPRFSKSWLGENRTSLDYIDDVNFFGGSERKIVSKNFKGGKSVSIFGGSVYVLTESELAEGNNILEVINIFGGVKLVIPSSWNVHLEVASIFGGFSDKRMGSPAASDSNTRVLYIKGVSIFGGGEIKSF